MRLTVPVSPFATQTDPKPTATAFAPAPTEIVRLTRFWTGSICQTRPPTASTTQTPDSPAATADCTSGRRKVSPGSRGGPDRDRRFNRARVGIHSDDLLVLPLDDPQRALPQGNRVRNHAAADGRAELPPLRIEAHDVRVGVAGDPEPLVVSRDEPQPATALGPRGVPYVVCRGRDLEKRGGAKPIACDPHGARGGRNSVWSRAEARSSARVSWSPRRRGEESCRRRS
jgi:hypothetical protein